MVAKNPKPVITDIYELSPMQEAMLFHSAYAPDSLAYFDQFSCVIRGELQVEYFRQAWQTLVNRHDVFRTSFHWKDLPKPIQVVQEQASIPWVFEDWTHLSPDLQKQKWQTCIEEDRRAGFQLDRAPLLRCRLVRLRDHEYNFAWSHHHIILDGWCLSLVLGELLEIYRALRSNEQPRLKPVRSYRDYITWLQQKDKASSRDYWSGELSGFTAPTELPSVTGDLSERSSMADANEDVLLSRDLSQSLRRLAAQHQITANMLTQGAWSILLSRYSGETDVLFGSTTSGRPAELGGVEDMLGVFINTLPVRVRVEPQSRLIAWLKRLQSEQTKRLQHTFLSLSDIQQHSEVPRGAALFHSNFIFMNYPISEDAVRGAGEFEISDVRIFEQTDIPLTLQVTPGERWAVEAIYDSSRFAGESIRRLLGHFINLLEEFVASPDRPIAAFPILTKDERHQLFYEFNDNRVKFDSAKTVVHRMEEIAALYPTRIAVECRGRTLTAAALNSRANQLARCLIDEVGLGPEDVAAILINRSERMIETILAIWKCGAAYVPIDTNYPDDRIKTIIGSAGAKVIITEKNLISAALNSNLNEMARVINLDEIEAIRAGQAASDLGVLIDASSLAYVIFTSGSTGKPKGAMVEHLGMLNHMLSKVRDLEISPASVIAQSASHCFDISLWQMFAAPMVGGKTIVYDESSVLEPDRFIDNVEADGVTIVELVPSYLSAVLDRVESRANVFSKLRYLQVTGEAVMPALVERWFKRFPLVPVANAYGPTECSDNITHYTMHEPPDTVSISIGKPLQNFNIYIVDDYMNLCPVGVKGEICASGVGVGRGYLKDPARTADVFVADPFSNEAGARLYKTGDIGCYMPDGNILLFGRKDHQVKVRGFRIELGEIETALARIEGIRESAVLSRRDGGKDNYLCAYYTSQSGSGVSREAIARELRRELPDYMIPVAFVEMDELPLTPNGKIDRKRLPAPDPTEQAARADYAAPRSETERVLSEVWAEALGIDHPGIHDNFFSLGGDSILSMQIVSRAKQAGLKLGVIDVFRHPTIAGLASRAVKIDPAKRESRVEAPRVSGWLPLTPVQKDFLETTTIDPHHYNQSVLVQMPAGINVANLERVISFVIARHDSLRLRFKLTDDGWRQELSESPAIVPFIVEDLSHAAESEQGAQVEAAAERLQASLDLSAGPLMLAALFMSGDEHPASLLLIVHHLAIDGVSWRILLEELATAYQQLDAGKPIQLPEQTTSYGEWSMRLIEYAQNEIGAEEKEYWLETARARESMASIPVDFRADMSANTVDSSEEFWVRLDETATAALLKEVPRAYNTQINDALLTALALTFGEWTGDNQIHIDLESHGREPLFDDIDLSRTTGWFTAEFPIILRLENNSSNPATHLKSIKEQLRKIPKRGIGYGLLRHYSTDAGPVQQLESSAQVLFNYLGQIDRSSKTGDGWKMDMQSIGAARSPRQLREHLIEVDGLVADGRVELSFSYSRNFHCRETIERIARSFKAHLLSIIEHCARPESGGFTPTDFPLAALAQKSLDVLFENLKASGASHLRTEIIDVYRLSPVQQGMLFHSLYTADTDAYFNQLTCLIEGALDGEVFARAWAEVIDHHPALRTSFHWEGLETPVQVVHRSAQAEWTVEDWSARASESQEDGWQDYLRQDRQRKFDLARPPLMRFGLFRLNDKTCRFNWAHHHLLMDGWSSAIVLNDVLMAYEAIINGKPCDLKARPLFRESIEWIARADSASAESYWREKLKAITVPTPLVLGRPEMEGSARDGDYAEQELLVSLELTDRLHKLARERGVTLNTIAQGAWSILLSRYSGEPDVVYGSIVSGRPPELEGADNIVGLFINTLPVPTHLDVGQPVIDWLERMQIEQAEREQYAHTSLTDIQRWSDAAPGAPLFESILIFENYPTEEFLLQGAGGLSITQVHAREPNNYPITLVVTPARQIALKLMYDDGRFDRETIERLLGHYEALLRQIAESPEQAIGALDTTTEAERRQILEAWNNTAARIPEDKTFIHLFEDRASLHPHSAAVQFDGKTSSYRQLNERANQLARCLLEAEQLKAGDRVAILMPRSDRMVESILAVWKCRAAYVPIDPGYPLERINTIIADSGSKLVIMDTNALGLGESAGDFLYKLIALDQLETTLAGQSKENLAKENLGGGPAAEDVAYVIYTSGSTGKPKGVMVEHRGMLNHILAMAQELEIGPGSVVAQTASHCFDISVWQFFSALACGGKTVVCSVETVLNPDALVDQLVSDAVEVVQFVPSYLAVLLDELERRRAPRLFKNLRWLVLIGEILKPAYARRWFDLYPDIRLMNAYGPTEASDSVTHYTMTQAPATASVPIGRPIQNMRVYVVDKQMKLCPIGVKGEICIGGIGVGRGYLGDEQRTEAAFIPDPFTADTQARLYRTGDIGCFAADGNLLFFGRKDHQIKIRGHRIELGEIESALVKIDGVRNAVVVHYESHDQKSLCAYVTLNEGVEKKPAELTLALSSQLPAYMIPHSVRILPELPLTTSGKIDRKRLPAVEIPESDRAASAQPETETERELIRIWQDVLGIKDVGLNDQFIDLGGHSLNTIQIVSRVRSQLRRDITFADIFESNTVRLLAARLDGLKEIAESVIPCLESSENYATSHAQQRIWLSSRSRERSIAYNMHTPVWLEGRLDKPAMRAAFQTLVERHESLRTLFVTTQGQLRQVIQPAGQTDFALEEIELRNSSDGEDRAAQIALEASETLFDLARGPLFKAKLIEVADSKHLLVITAHHIIGDAWSLQVIFDELLTLYAASLENRAPQVSPLKIQYRDFADWHNRWLKSADAENDRAFWLAQLSREMPRVSIPADFSTAAHQTFAGDSVAVSIEQGRVHDLRRLAEKHKTSVYAVVLSAIYSLVFRYTNQEDIVIGTQTAGRSHADLEGQVGCFVNTLALRSRVRGADTVSDVVRNVSHTLSEALAHQGYPFDMIVDELKSPLSQNQTPLFDIQVDYVPNLNRSLLNRSLSHACGDVLKITGLSQRERSAKYALSFMIGDSPEGGLTIEVAYNTSLFKRESILTLAARLDRVLQAFVKDETERIDAIELSGKLREPLKVRVELNIPG